MRLFRRHRSRGQAAVETALIAPVLVLLTLGAADLSRAYYFNIETSGAARAGMRIGIQGGFPTDIGDALRSEPDSAISNNDANWGLEGPGAAQTNNCNNNVAHTCGDPNGCVAASFVGTQVACFAVQTCTQDVVTSQWSVCGPWGVRPASKSASALHVIAVYKFRPATPVITRLAGASGNFYLTGSVTGIESY